MELSNELEIILEKEIKESNIKLLKEEAKRLSKRYCEEERKNQNFITSEETALAYAIIRMPATYEAVKTVLNELENRIGVDIKNVKNIFDLGSGTGGATIALKEKNLESNILCFEREKNMIDIAQKITSFLEYDNISWENKDLLNEKIDKKADIVLESYLCNEWEDEKVKKFAKQMFEISNKFVIFIEPGTPESFWKLQDVKEIAKENEFNLLAPCPTEEKCYLDKDDWCHSICRVSRSKTHKLLKEGDLSYEDEKFSYLIFSKQKYDKNYMRILRKPIIEKNKTCVKVCTNTEIKELTITKKDKELYKNVKKKKMRRYNLVREKYEKKK